MYTKILSTGSYLPEKVLTNTDLEAKVETTDAWIQERTGIIRRHIAADHETSSVLAEYAARQAIDRAGVHVKDIDMIVVATTTPDCNFPSTACVLQDRLGMTGCPAFDVSAVCSGFIYALSVVDQFIKTGAVTTALVVGAETLSRLIDWEDRTTCILFGDGAGAVIVQASNEPGIHSTHLHADGKYKNLLYAPSHVHGKEAPYVRMKGREVFKVAVNTLDSMVDEVLQANDIQKSAIDWLVPHQANTRIIEATAKKLKMPLEKVVLTVSEHANTSAASIPLALDTAVSDGRIQRGHNLLLEAFGAGFAWGSAYITY